MDLCQNFDDSLLDWILKRYAFSCVRMVQNGKSMFSSLKINFRLKIKKNNQYRIICKCNIIVEKGTYPFLEVGMVMFRKIILSNLFWRKFYWANTLRNMNITYLEKLSCQIFSEIFFLSFFSLVSTLLTQTSGNKARVRISKRVLRENRARQICLNIIQRRNKNSSYYTKNS